MSKAAELAALIGSQTALSNRNLVINGAMAISQRGTSSTGITSSGYRSAPDRFRPSIGSAGTWTISQSTDVPTGEGFAHSYKFDCTTAKSSLDAGSDMALQYRFEGQDLQLLKKGTSSAAPVTVSFYVKSTKTGTFILELMDNDNAREISKSYTISSSNTWERKTVTFEGDTTGALDDDNARSFTLQWWLVAGTNFSSGTLNTSWSDPATANRVVGQVNIADSTSNDWLLTGVQLEVGEQATPFEHRTFHDEFMRCQRYYQEIHGGSCEPSSSSVVETSFTRLPMRAAATGSVSAAIDIEDPNVTTYTQSSGAISVNNATARAEKIGLSNFSSLGTSKSFFIKTTGGHIQLDAEL